MGRLIIVILVASALWMGYWAAGSIALERSVTSWIDLRRDDGWVADVADVDVAGFPNRFDTTLTDIRFADPETGVAWSAPFLQLLALSYRPNQVIAVLPPEHRLSTPIQSIDITSDLTRGSIFLGASTQLPLERSTIVAENLALTSSLGWTIDLPEARFATEPVEIRENAHRIGAEITDLRPPEDLIRTLDPLNLLPERIDTFRLDAEMGFTAPWDRRALEVARPQITDLDLGDLSMRWGDIVFRAAGQITVDGTGRPDGQIDIRAEEWQQVLDIAIASGLLDNNLRPTIERGLGLLATLSGNPNTLDVPLTFRNGQMRVGPIPLGQAPRLIIR